MSRTITVDVTDVGPHRLPDKITGEQMFHAIRKVLLRNLAADGRVRNIRSVAAMEFRSYDETDAVLTVTTPPGTVSPTPKFINWLDEISTANNFPIKRFSFVSGTEPQASSGQDGHVIVERPHRMKMKTTEWLWSNYIPLGRITILAGDPGIGKSQAAIELIARITKGKNMPDESAGLLGNCAIATAEDETSQTIIPRLRAAGADISRTRIIRKVKIDGNERYLKLPRDLSRLRQVISDERLRLLVIDPLNAFVDSEVNTYKDQDIRSVLAPVEGMAEELGCSVLIIAHLNKKEDASVLYRVGGSIGFIGAARSVLAVQYRNKNNEAEGRVLYALKANLSRKPPAQALKVVDCTVREDSTGEDIKTSKVVWLGTCADPSRAAKDEGPQMRKACLDFLIEIFSTEYQVPSIEIQRAAKEYGLPWRTLCEYKPKFKIDSVKMQDGRWSWRAPEGGLSQFRKASQ